jgi:predicted DNA-binding protein (MmcQ/YjbR family)
MSAGAYARLREICLAFPEAVEKPFGGHTAPAFRVRDKFFVMTWDNDGRAAAVFKAPPGAREFFVGQDPKRFFRPAYVGPKGWLGINLDAGVDWDQLSAMIDESYRMTAPKKLVALLDGA